MLKLIFHVFVVFISLSFSQTLPLFPSPVPAGDSLKFPEWEVMAVIIVNQFKYEWKRNAEDPVLMVQ